MGWVWVQHVVTSNKWLLEIMGLEKFTAMVTLSLLPVNSRLLVRAR